MSKVEPPKDEADKFYQNHRINVTDDGIATPRQPQSSPPLESAVDELLEDYDIDIHSPMKRDEYVQRVLALLKLQQEALLRDLSKSFIDDKDYKGYMVKQVIEARQHD